MNQRATAIRSETLDQIFAYHLDQSLAVLTPSDYPMVRHQVLRDSGIRNPELIDELSSTGISIAAIYVLTLAPIVHFAWSDESITSIKRKKIMQAVHRRGIAKNSTGWLLLESWLRRQPDCSLFRIWQDYAGALKWIMSVNSYKSLNSILVSQVEALISVTANGFGLLGASTRQTTTLVQIKEAFAPT